MSGGGKSEEELRSTSYVDLDAIRREFLKYAPEYARDGASEALDKVSELKKEGLLHHGVYYVVLADLVGSTKYAAAHGNDASRRRIQHFVTSSFDALNAIRLESPGLFVKEIGDAVLFIFQHFPDVIRWQASFLRYLAANPAADEEIKIRTCVHVGEVFLDGVNPLSLAVSQAFKMEKAVGAGDLVLTDPAYHVAWPTIARAHRGFADYGQVDLAGFPAPVQLHKLRVYDGDDLERIVVEKLDD